MRGLRHQPSACAFAHRTGDETKVDDLDTDQRVIVVGCFKIKHARRLSVITGNESLAAVTREVVGKVRFAFAEHARPKPRRTNSTVKSVV